MKVVSSDSHFDFKNFFKKNTCKCMIQEIYKENFVSIKNNFKKYSRFSNLFLGNQEARPGIHHILNQDNRFKH